LTPQQENFAPKRSKSSYNKNLVYAQKEEFEEENK